MSRASLWFKVLLDALRSHSNQQFYDRISPIYDQVFTQHEKHAINMANLLGSAKGSARVIDLGCGTGMLSRILSDRGFDVVGLDISFESLKLLSQHQPRIYTIQSDATLLPFMDNSFHAVVSLGAWRHFPDPQGVLEEITRILTSDGILIIGYFPPALGGAIHQSEGIWHSFLVSMYQFAVRIRGYEDRADILLESQTVKLAGGYFNKTRTVVSGEHWNLIVASKPKSTADP